jgi:hypothetical protein
MRRHAARAPSGLTYIPIGTYEELIEVLQEASELEHMLMCQYLFAAYSLKRSQEEGLSAVELERARRIESRITLVARQEMEHLGLVLNMMSAIGARPYIGRPEFPQGPFYYSDKADLPMVLTPVSSDTLQRFERFEAPHLEGEDLSTWCLRPAPVGGASQEALGGVSPIRELLSSARARKPARRSRKGQRFEFSSVQELYVSLWHAFPAVSETMRAAGRELFVGSRGAQIFGGPQSPFHGTMNDLNQYGLDIIPVADVKSAQDAVSIILLQGEGVVTDEKGDHPGPEHYRDYTHYCLFRTSRLELERKPFEAARRVVPNPRISEEPPPPAGLSVNLITDPVARQVGDAFNLSYQLMLKMLLSLYGNQDWEKQLSQQLTDAVFFPMMTMFVRPLSEVLTQLPAFAGSDQERAGPSFELGPEALRPIPTNEVWQEVLTLLRKLRARLEGITFPESPGERGAQEAERRYPRAVRERLREISLNADRLTEDWRNHWQNIGRS